MLQSCLFRQLFFDFLYLYVPLPTIKVTDLKLYSPPLFLLWFSKTHWVFSVNYANISLTNSIFNIAPAKLPEATARATERIIEVLSPQANTPGTFVFCILST